MKHYISITLLSLSSLQRWFISSVIIIFITGIGWWYGIRSYHQRITATQTTIHQHEQEYELLLTALHNHQKTLKQHNTLRTKYQKLTTRFFRPLSETLTLLLSKIRSGGCVTETIQCQPLKQKEWYSTSRLTIQCHTKSYTGLKNFLHCCKELQVVPHTCSITASKKLLTCFYSGKIITIPQEKT